MGVQADDCFVSILEVAGEPLDLVCVHVRGAELDRGRQIEDDGVFLGWLPRILDRLADLEGVIQFGVRKAFRGILQLHLGSLEFGEEVADQLHPVHRDLLDLFPRHVEGHPALQGRG